MGFFKDIKSMVSNANELTKTAQAQQAAAQQMQAQAAQAQSAQVDLTNPMWAPVEGITVDKYAEITARMVKQGVTGIEAVTAFVEANGVPAGKWQAVNAGWTARMGQYMDVRTRYGLLYSQFLS